MALARSPKHGMATEGAQIRSDRGDIRIARRESNYAGQPSSLVSVAWNAQRAARALLMSELLLALVAMAVLPAHGAEKGNWINPVGDTRLICLGSGPVNLADRRACYRIDTAEQLTKR